MAATENRTVDPVGRLAARTAQLVAVVIALGTVVVGFVLTGARLTGPIPRTVDVLADGVRPGVGGADDLPIFYTSVRVMLEDPSVGVRLLAWAAPALNGILILAGCTVAFLLIGRTLTGRFFSRATTVGLLGFGVLMVVTAVAAPWLDAQATLVGVQELGLRLADAGTGVFGEFDRPASEVLAPDALWWGEAVLANTHWLLAGVGVIVVLVGVAFGIGERLQRDTEGLV